MKSRVLAILLVVALLVTVAVFSVQAESTVKTPAEAQTIIDAAKASSFTSQFVDKDTTVDASCPVCGENVTWHPLASGASGVLAVTDEENAKAHYYLAESFNVTGKYLRTVDDTNPAEYCLYLNGNTITAESLRGIWVQYGNTLNLLGETGGITAAGTGAVADNTAHRGAIDAVGAVNIYGGVYQNGSAARAVISARNYDFPLNIYGGTIQSNNDAYAVYMYNANNKGEFNVVGGTIDGGVCIDIEGADVSVDGTAVINSDNGGLDLTEGALLTLGDNLASGADITVTVNDGAFTNESANAGTIADAGYIKDTEAGKAVRANSSGQLYLDTVYNAAIAMQSTDSTTGIFDAANGEDVSAVCPYCGTVETWTAVDSEYGYELAGEDDKDHFYLTGALSTSSNAALKVTGVVCLHLNGNNVSSTNTSTGAVDVYNGSTLTVMGRGEIRGIGQNNTRPGALTCRGTANLFGGTWMSAKNSATYYAVALFGSNRVLNIYDGTVIQRDPDITNSGCILLHGTYATNPTVNMYGGTIQNGNATTGGNICVNGVKATLNISGGLITSGFASGNGGNIFVKGLNTSDEAVINISGTAQITNGESQGTAGGGIYMSSYVDLVMTGGTVSGNEAVSGGNFAFTAGSNNVTISGGIISDGTSDNYGGNIYISSGNATVEIEGGTISGGTANAGGSIYGVGKLNITGGIITGGTATANGGCINISAGTLTISGGQIGIDKDGNAAGGTATGNGGNLYLASSTAATISGDAVIANGSAKRGGNIGFGNSAQLTINADAEDAKVVPNISGGTATQYGGNIYATGAFTMNAGNVQGGYAAEEGGSMYFMNWDNTADVNIAINGGVIDGKPYETAGVNNGGHGGLIYAYTNPDQASGKGLTLTLKDVTLTNGKIDTAYNGSAVYMSGSTLILDGDTQIDDSNNDVPVYFTGTSTMTVNADFTGEVRVYASLADGTTYGDQMLSSGTGAYTCTGEYTGTVRLLNITGACAVGKYETSTSTGTLWVAGVALCKDGEVVDGALTAANAVAKFASGNYDFIRSYTDETTFELTDNTVTYVIDLDGRDITVNAASGVTGVTFLGIDTEASTSAASGAVATLGDGVVNGYRAQDDDITYVGLQAEDSNTVTVHAMKMQVTAVALRTTTGGIYYWSSYECDDTLAAAVDSFGLVYNLGSAPSTDLAQNMVATELAKGDFVRGEDIIGGIMNNILVAGARTDSDGEPVDLTNDQAADLAIYAAPYISVIGADGGAKMVMADASEDTMYLVVKAIDDMISGMEDSDAKKAQYINMMNKNFNWAGYAFEGEKWSQFTNFGPAAQ